MEYSLITKDENGCQVVVRSANSLENLIRNIIIDNIRYTRGIDRDVYNNNAYIDYKHIGDSFVVKYKLFDFGKKVTVHSYNTYKVMYGESTVKICKIIPMWKNIREGIANSALCEANSTDYDSYRKSYCGVGSKYRNSACHNGKIKVLSELRKNKGYDAYCKENTHLSLPRSRKLPEVWGSYWHKNNARGNRDWKRNKCRKQWMKHKRYVKNTPSIRELYGNIVNYNKDDTNNKRINISEDLNRFYKIYRNDINKEILNNKSDYDKSVLTYVKN